MAGAKIEITYNDRAVRRAVSAGVDALASPRPLFANIREYLLRVHRQRFQDQKAPDGTPWQALSPSYQKRKRENSDRILYLRGYLANTLRGVIDDNGLAFGTDRVYGAIHQFGGTIQHKARASRRSNFAQDATIGKHETRTPARPWLGTSDENDNYILEMTRDYLSNAMRR